MIETTARKEFIVELALVPQRPQDLFWASGVIKTA
jgi:hypothetical protein